jgi:hypothetical protein
MLSRCDMWCTKLHWDSPLPCQYNFTSTHLLTSHLSSVVTIRTSGRSVGTLKVSPPWCIGGRGGGVSDRKSSTRLCLGYVKNGTTYFQPSASNRILYTPDPSQRPVFIIRLCNLCRPCKLLQATSWAPLSTLRDVWCVVVCVCVCQQNLKTTSAIFSLRR